MEILEFCADKLRSRGLGDGAGQFQLRREKSSGTSIEVKGGRVENLNKSTDEGLSIRTLRDGRMGFSYTFDLSKDTVEKAVGGDRA